MGRQEVSLSRDAQHLQTTQMGKFNQAVNPSATTCVHWQHIISTHNMFPSHKRYIFFACHTCHFGNFPGENSKFHICKHVWWEEWRGTGWHYNPPKSLPGRADSTSFNHPQAQTKATASDRKEKTREYPSPWCPLPHLEKPLSLYSSDTFQASGIHGVSLCHSINIHCASTISAVPNLSGTRSRFRGGGGGRDGSGGNASDGGRWGAADEASLTRPGAHFLLFDPVPNRPLPWGVGDPCTIWPPLFLARKKRDGK